MSDAAEDWALEAHQSIDALLAPRPRKLPQKLEPPRPSDAPEPEPAEKRCRRCARKREISKFLRSSRSRDGRQTVCVDCNESCKPTSGTRKSKRCLECEGMPHRRQQPACIRCGLPYVPEAPVELDATSRKSVNDHLGFGR